MEEKTVFEKILDGELPSDKVYEDEDVFAFNDIDPQAPTHVLVIPKKRARDFSELAEADAEWVGRYMKGIAQVVTELGVLENGYRVVFNSGRDGQQSVAYLHAHILGGRRLSWPPG